MSPDAANSIPLRPGRHDSPKHGVCVVELASMLGGEPFSDHPKSVSPAIASFLRCYNDTIDDRRRQDLHECAAKIVASRGSAQVERVRADRLSEWAVELQTPRWRRWLSARRKRTIRETHPPPVFAVEVVGTRVVDAIPRHTDETHAAALAMVDELLAVPDVQPGGRAAPEVTPAH
jgi:hypothetical protein